MVLKRKRAEPGRRPARNSMCGNPNLVALGRVIDLPRILDHRDGRDVDVDQLAVTLLHAADVDVLDDVALLRIDHDRPAWAADLLALHELDVLQAIRIWTKP